LSFSMKYTSAGRSQAERGSNRKILTICGHTL
jgi:hypothetical protein